VFKSRHIIPLLLLAGMILTTLTAVSADDLPPSAWYAVAWVQGTDRLHWINPSGEQGSISRPTLANEAQDHDHPTRLWIAPDGRTLVTAAPLNNGRHGIGFYDLASGQWVQTHETQADEVVVNSGDFTTTSSHFATVLRNQVSGDWRVLVFETATGSAVAQLYRTDPTIPDAIYNDDPAWYPLIASFAIDEGFGTPSLRMQMRSVSEDPQTYAGGVPSFRWYPMPPPALANAPVVADVLNHSPLPGIDVFETTGQTVQALADPQVMPATAYIGRQIVLLESGQQTPLVTDMDFSLSHPRWLRGGDWIGYRVQSDDVFAAHLAITTPQGGDGLPLGPNIGEIYATPDGFLAIDTDTFRLYHATDLNIEAFAANFGATLFQPAVPFSIIYTTPEGASFGLTTLANTVTLGGMDVAAPAVTCPGAPTPRLTPGGMAMVAFTDGAPLNLRNAPAGEQVGQLPEGTIVTLENIAPQCVNGYLWWTLRLTDEATAWAAEGAASGYFLEPYVEGLQLQTGVQTTPLVLQAATIVPTPLPLPPQECLNLPVTRLALGDTAHVVGTDGTLAVYLTPTDDIPAYQLPIQQTVTIIGGFACRDGARMWQINATLNDVPITGWVSEGFGQTYFLQPGPGRALS